MAKQKRKEKKEEKCECDSKDGKCGCRRCKGGCGAIYGLGLIGAAIYYISQATTFWQGVLGFLKAIVWPVFLVLKILGM